MNFQSRLSLRESSGLFFSFYARKRSEKIDLHVRRYFRGAKGDINSQRQRRMAKNSTRARPIGSDFFNHELTRMHTNAHESGPQVPCWSVLIRGWLHDGKQKPSLPLSPASDSIRSLCVPAGERAGVRGKSIPASHLFTTDHCRQRRPLIHREEPGSKTFDGRHS